MIFSEFLELAKKKGVDCIILPDGNISDAIWGHVNRLVKIAGGEKIWEIAPIDAATQLWLVDYTNCISVSEEAVFLPEYPTIEQLSTLKELFRMKLLRKSCLICQCFEKSRNNTLQEMRRAENFKLKMKEPKLFQSVDEVIAVTR